MRQPRGDGSTGRRWRGITVGMVIWTLPFALALLSGTVSLVAEPCTAPASVCYGALLGAMMLGMVWLIGFGVLGVIWLVTRPPPVRAAQPPNASAPTMTRPPPCPRCRDERLPGQQFCDGCGFDFWADYDARSGST